MKKRLLSFILTLCTVSAITPQSAFADTADYKETYYNFLKNTFITQHNSNHWHGIALSDLNLDGTPELIMYDGGAVSSNGLHIIQIIDNQLQMRYEPFATHNDYVAEDYREYVSDNYSESDVDLSSLFGTLPNPSYEDSDVSPIYTFSLRQNRYTNDLMYVHNSNASEIESYKNTLMCFSTDNIFTATAKFREDVNADDSGNIEQETYYIDGKIVSKDVYNTEYNTFTDTWLDTGYQFAFLDRLWDNSSITEQKIKDFLDSYIPEKQALGIDSPNNADPAQPSEWAAAEIQRAISYDLITDTKHLYQNYITRKEFTELIVTCIDKLVDSTVNAPKNIFSDIDSDAVDTAYAMGIVNGIDEHTFAPDNNITRQEIAVMMYRAIKYVETANKKTYLVNETSADSYIDNNTVADWARNAVGTLANNSIMLGTSDNTLSPLANTTIEQAILLDVRIFELMK